ncbi:cation-translocating P-type ATPase [Thiomonas sp. FB-6]|uniref:heavy metal translocating P-type ATPase n=1 Tax=Thiomonas sp. FB-6 TaxID=1158291 RepID=UPI00036E9E17|nr:heavy metal translocating P-type ATPase [Thiomonas sp. FB-6]
MSDTRPQDSAGSRPDAGACGHGCCGSMPLSAAPDAAPRDSLERSRWLRLLGALALALFAEWLGVYAAPGTPWRTLGMGAAVLAVALSGLSVLREGLTALVKGRLDIAALMAVAVAGAFALGQWPEAAMVMTLFALAERIEARSVERARDAIRGLLALSPARVELRQPDGSWRAVDARSAAVGAIARVRPGERFALDGTVRAGRGAVDESPITGESLPVDKSLGDEVFAGSINRDGSLEYEVTRAPGDTVLARIIEAVEQAQARRAPTQRFVERFARVYTPAVFVLAVAVALGAPLWLGWAWHAAVYRALVLLVIACPCALVISTPVTVVSALAFAARRGILLKGGVYLEQARRIRVVALDKTGTLTEGRPTMVARAALDARMAPPRAFGLARALALRSDHPLARALAAGLADVSDLPDLPDLSGAVLPEVEDFGAQPGRGVHGVIDGAAYVLGSHRWIAERGQCTPALQAALQEQEARGRSVSVLADAQGPLAWFTVADTPRPHSREALAELRELGVRTLMLTGDNEATARAIAGQVGIDEVHAGLLPQDKLALVRRLGETGTVAMVGDGINDAPALGAAHIGFAMGGAGADVATEAADVVIMGEDPRRVAQTIRLSRRAQRVLRQNIALALGIKAVFLALALAGDASMWMAVFADTGASLLVVFNGLRLTREPVFRAWGMPGRAVPA